MYYFTYFLENRFLNKNTLKAIIKALLYIIKLYILIRVRPAFIM